MATPRLRRAGYMIAGWRVQAREIGRTGAAEERRKSGSRGANENRPREVACHGISAVVPPTGTIKAAPYRSTSSDSGL